MYVIYNLFLLLLILVLSPVWIIILLSAAKHRAGFLQKLGFLPPQLIDNIKAFKSRPVWFHAVSVGECLAVVDLVTIFHQRFPEIPLVVSTVTYTGQDIAKKRLGNIANIIYLPYDIGFIVNKILKILHPQLFVIVETEIWPNLSFNLFAKKVPLVMINGRISPKSYKNYLNFKFFVSRVLGCFTFFLMQSKIDLERILMMGAPANKVQLVGNLKYDIKAKFTSEDILKLRNELAIKEGDQVLIAGSTHAGEEDIVLNLYIKLKDHLPSLKFILVPRHPERYDEVIDLIKNKNLNFGRRTLKSTFEDSPILLLDTMGELSTFYSISTVAFIGGSLIQKGGHNPLEPAVYDIPVVVGQYTFNFLEISDYMQQSGALIKVQDQNEFYEVLLKLFTDKNYYEASQNSCKQVFKLNSGATERTLSVLASLLTSDRAKSN